MHSGEVYFYRNSDSLIRQLDFLWKSRLFFDYSIITNEINRFCLNYDFSRFSFTETCNLTSVNLVFKSSLP